jgi:hypothetical protein
LGRQLLAGGAARFARFDGARVSGEIAAAGIDATFYGGLTALPRWNERPGYQLLGSTSESLLRDPEALPEPERSGYWLTGGRIGWASKRASAGASFHEEHADSALSRRNLGADASVDVLSDLSFATNLVFELDAEALQDARVWLDATPFTPLDLSFEYLHTEPALFLPRQSVLAVFGSDAYDELGGSAELAVDDSLAFASQSFVQFHSAGERGVRTEVSATVRPGSGRRTLVRFGYGRVVAPENGYHSVRTSLGRRFDEHLHGTLELYAYLYDEPVSGLTASSVYAGTLGYRFSDSFDVTWGASLARSPYASLDAQTLLSASYDFDFSVRGGR